MTDIEITKREHGKMLRNAHPLDRWAANARVVNAVGRLTAQKLNKNPAFADAIENKNIIGAGNIWHHTANEVAKIFAARMQKWSVAPEMKSEATIKSGLGGSRADVLFKQAQCVLAEFDWKTNGKSAMKSVSQMKRHATQAIEKFGEKPKVQQSRSWFEYVRECAPGAAKDPNNIFNHAKTKAAAVTQKPFATSSGIDNFKRSADSNAVAEWTERVSTRVSRVQSQGASNLPTRSGQRLGARGAPKLPASSSGEKFSVSVSSSSVAKLAAGGKSLSTKSGADLGDRGATKFSVGSSAVNVNGSSAGKAISGACGAEIKSLVNPSNTPGGGEI